MTTSGCNDIIGLAPAFLAYAL